MSSLAAPDARRPSERVDVNGNGGPAACRWSAACGFWVYSSARERCPVTIATCVVDSRRCSGRESGGRLRVPVFRRRSRGREPLSRMGGGWGKVSRVAVTVAPLTAGFALSTIRAGGGPWSRRCSRRGL